MLTKGDEYPIHQTAEPIAYSGTDRNFYDRYFFNGYKDDGSDFFAVHEASAALIARARAESLPAVLEVKVNRWSGHFTGDPQPYRSAEELGQARGVDPLRIFREKVIGAGLLDEATFAALDAAALKLIEDSSQKAVAAPYPDISELTTDVYVSY
jgi:pyruvate dehydrogenase E1 component alpha subunit